LFNAFDAHVKVVLKRPRTLLVVASLASRKINPKWLAAIDRLPASPGRLTFHKHASLVASLHGIIERMRTNQRSRREVSGMLQ
jgi:hypothetical protein